MKGSAYTLGYAAVLGVVCALLLTGAARFTEDARNANAEAEEALNVLLALKVPLPEKITSMRVLELRDENVQEKDRGGITTYEYSRPEENGKVLAVAMRFQVPDCGARSRASWPWSRT